MVAAASYTWTVSPAEASTRAAASPLGPDPTITASTWALPCRPVPATVSVIAVSSFREVSHCHGRRCAVPHQ